MAMREPARSRKARAKRCGSHCSARTPLPAGSPDGKTNRYPGEYAAFSSTRETGHIDDKTVFDVALDHPRIGFLDVLNVDHLDIRDDVVLGAEIQHFLRLLDPADGGAGNAAPAEQQAEDPRGRVRRRRCA